MTRSHNTIAVCPHCGQAFYTKDTGRSRLAPDVALERIRASKREHIRRKRALAKAGA